MKLLHSEKDLVESTNFLLVHALCKFNKTILFNEQHFFQCHLPKQYCVLLELTFLQK